MSNSSRYIDRLLDLPGAPKFVDAKGFDKDFIYRLFFNDMMQRCLSMFEWKGLPDEVKSYQLELYKQLYGTCIFTKVDGKYYVFFGNFSGESDAYYYPKFFIVANPWLNLNREFEIGKDCVLIKNDFLFNGLARWNAYYAYQLAEVYCTMRIGMITARAEYVLATANDNEAKGAKAFLESLEAGNKLGYIVDENFMNEASLRSLPFSSGSVDSIRGSMECAQYLFSQWARGVGLSSSFNRKREYVSDGSTSIGDDVITPRVEQMYECAKLASDQINQLFGLNTSVDYSSSWQREINMLDNPQQQQQPDEGGKPKDKEDGKKEEDKDEKDRAVQ